jgi:hypothetical protein
MGILRVALGAARAEKETARPITINVFIETPFLNRADIR